MRFRSTTARTTLDALGAGSGRIRETAASIAALNNLSAAQVNAEVVDALKTGHNKASAMGAITINQPGKSAPDSIRTVNSSACAATKTGNTCMACEGTVNHSKRR